MFILPVLVCVAGLCLGSAALMPQQLIDALLGRDSTAAIIFWHLRLPRVAAGVVAGVGLAVAGVLLQSVTANDLASPNILGINSGAGLAVIGMLTFFPGAASVLPLGAFVGAFGAALLILLAAGRLGSGRSHILLMGIAVTTVCNAAISFLSLLDEGVLAQYSHFTVGSLKAVTLGQLALPAVIVVLGLGASLVLSSKLGVLCLGDEAAAALGIRVKALRLGALAIAAACAAAVVSFAGLLGFVGLVVPHMAKSIAGQQPAKSLPVAAACGVVTVVLADLLGRTLFAPSELPVGILMSLIGAPYFLLLLLRRNRHGHIG